MITRESARLVSERISRRFHARAEANDNVKFLAPLRKWVEQLEDCTDYSVLPESYPPIVHERLHHHFCSLGRDTGEVNGRSRAR